MTAYIISPNLTLVQSKLAYSFYEKCLKELVHHVSTQPILAEIVMGDITLNKEDAVIFFNNKDQNYSEYVTGFLEDAVEVECAVLPIAIEKEYRFPPVCLAMTHSFDVTEQLRQRCLSEAQIETIAIVFARTIVSRVQPTLSKNNMYLFLSHRRMDGEEIAGAFYDAFSLRSQQSFRDLNKVLVGEDAQEIIEENLRQCDAVIYLDTPKSGDSKWIALELEIALSRGLPIVWVRIGPEEGREKKYFVKVADVPHFHFPDLNISDSTINQGIIDNVIHKAFEISRNHAKQVLGHIKRIKSLAKSGALKLKELNKQDLTYQIQIPRQGFRYHQRPMTHIVSFYGRIPIKEERDQFLRRVVGYGYGPHPLLGTIYDTALILAPIASQYNDMLLDEPHKVDSCDEYINHLEHFVRISASKPTSENGIIISGSFPDCEPEHQQNITNAVRAFTQAILTRKNKIIFGAHPTFQPLIFDMAKQLRTLDYREAVSMYISRHFASEKDIIEAEKNATVIPIDEIEKDRNKSLTSMRTSMIKNGDIACMVVIGGKTLRPGIISGVDEEVELAKSNGIPVFLIGSTGGRTAQIAAELDANNWNENLNDLPAEYNHELMVSVDYSSVANEILDKLGL